MPQQLLVKRVLTLLILSYIFFFCGNSMVSLTDPDEVFYSLTAREMTAHNDWLTPYIFNQPQFEKPIFAYWLLKIAFNAFGSTPFAARFFPAVFATMGVLAVYALGLLGFKQERRAFWSALVLGTSAFYIAMGKTVFTDMIFSVFILYALLSFYLAFFNLESKRLGIVGFYFFSALAVLTKGPLGLAIPELTVILFLLYRGQMNFLKDRWVIIGFILCFLTAAPWYIWMITKYGQPFIHEFFYNDHWRRWLEAEHKSNDHWFFYPVTMLAGMFPWTLFLAAGLIGLYKKSRQGISTFDHFILSWILIVFIVFQSAHSKLASYILPIFPALAFLAGDFIEEQLSYPGLQKKIKIFLSVMAGLVFLFGTAVFLAYPAYKKYLDSMAAVYFLSGMLITWAGILITLVLKDKIILGLGFLGTSFLPLVLAAYFVRADIEPYISSFEASQYLPHAPVKTILLSSKPYARGLRYYTGEDIAVLDINGSNYFSPHPIPILNTMDKLTEFLQAQRFTYAVVKKGAYKILTALPADAFRVTPVKTVGYNYILTIESLSNS